MIYLKRLIIESGLLRFTRNLQSNIEKQWFSNAFDARMHRNAPVLIYQMGKVASSAIYASLEKVYSGIVLHTHTFGASDDDWRIRKIYEYSTINRKPLNIITLTREPIGRNISAFFQNFERDTGVSYKRSNASLIELRMLFLKNYKHNVPLEWFDIHIKANFGVDVYATPFPDSGIEIYEDKNYRILIMRSEIDDNAKSLAIRQFLGLSNFHVKRKNIGSTKPYANTYRLFKDTVRLPSDYITKMCNSKYFSHFYSNDFVERVRQQWEHR